MEFIEIKKGTKERKIGEIVKKVYEWRRLYNGFTIDGSKKRKSLSLFESAAVVQVNKKSLDDYMLQIKQGFTNNFPWNKMYNEKVGKLREWNKKAKKMAKEVTVRKKRRDGVVIQKKLIAVGADSS